MLDVTAEKAEGVPPSAAHSGAALVADALSSALWGVLAHPGGGRAGWLPSRSLTPRLEAVAFDLLSAVLRRVDVNAVLERVDVQRIVDRIDVVGVLGRVDLDELAARVDLDALLWRVDVPELARRPRSPPWPGRPPKWRIVPIDTGGRAPRDADRRRGRVLGSGGDHGGDGLVARGCGRDDRMLPHDGRR